MIEFKSVTKTYQEGKVATTALKSVDLTIEANTFLMVLGPSGSGKSTMLNLMGALDKPTEGQISVDGEPISQFDEKQLTHFRRRRLGFVFQEYNLLQSLSAAENVEVTARISENPLAVDEVLEKVGLLSHKDKFPYELSGGEQQRLSIARALVKQPKILFCDEPTGSLDEKTAKDVLGVLKKLNEEDGVTIVLITHNQSLAKIANRIIRLNSGEIADDTSNTPEPVEAIHF